MLSDMHTDAIRYNFIYIECVCRKFTIHASRVDKTKSSRNVDERGIDISGPVSMYTPASELSAKLDSPLGRDTEEIDILRGSRL